MQLHGRDLANGRAVFAQEVVPLPRVDAEVRDEDLRGVSDLARRWAAGGAAGASFPGPGGILALVHADPELAPVELDPVAGFRRGRRLRLCGNQSVSYVRPS